MSYFDEGNTVVDGEFDEDGEFIPWWEEYDSFDEYLEAQQREGEE